MCDIPSVMGKLWTNGRRSQCVHMMVTRMRQSAHHRDVSCRPVEPLKPQILVIEDDEAISEAIAFHLDRAGFEPVLALDGLAGLRALRQGLPDVLVLDLMLPHVDGWHIIREVRDWAPRLPVIVVTARSNEHDRVEVLALGADDVLSKPFSMREFVARVTAALRRTAAAEAFNAREPFRAGDLELDMDRLTIAIAGVPVDTTPLEFRLMCVLAEHPGRAMSRDVIFRKVWGGERAHGDRSVDVLVRRLRRKVDEIPGRFTYVQTQHGVGYRLEATPRALPGAAAAMRPPDREEPGRRTPAAGLFRPELV